jgi:NADH:ubiquinone oxidoreductase subunit 2 (subunit N)
LYIGFFFIFIYLLITFFFFLILFFTRNILTGNHLIYISDLIFIKDTYINLIFIIIFLSLSGFPPFLGFFSKFFIFSGIVFLNYINYVFFLIFYSIYSSVYYFRILKQLLFLNLKNKNNIFICHLNFYLNKFVKLNIYIFFFGPLFVNYINEILLFFMKIVTTL